MKRIVGCVAITAGTLGLHHAGIVPTWLAVTVGMLAMVAATVLLAIEDLG